jgi:hypothetical protein
VSEHFNEENAVTMDEIPRDFDDLFPEGRKPTCKICAAEGLEWEDVGGQWLLHEPDGTVHRCPETTGEFVFDPDMGFRPK